MADLLSVIAIGLSELSELSDLSELFSLLGEEFGQLGLGVALVLPIVSTSPLTRASQDTESVSSSMVHYLCDSTPRGDEQTSIPSPSLSSPPALSQANGTFDLHLERAPRFISEFAPLASQVLPRAVVDPQDAGLLLPFSRQSGFQGLMAVWGDLSAEDVIPFSAFVGMLSLSLRVIRQTAIQQSHHHAEQTVLLDLAQVLIQGREIPDVLNQVAGIIYEVVETTFVTLYLYDSDSAHMIPMGTHGWDGGPPIPIEGPVDDTFINGISYVYHKRQPVIVDDELTEARFGVPDIAKAMGIQSVVMVPMLSSDGAVLGAIVSSSRQSYAMNEGQVRLFSLIASNTAQSIERLRLFQDAERQLNELTILHQASRLSTETEDEETLVTAITDLIGSVLFSDSFGFVFWNEAAGGLVVHPSYRSADPERADFGQVLSLDGSICGRVYRTGKPYCVGDATQDPLYTHSAGDMRSELCVPLLVGGKVLGVINAEDHRLNRFSAEDEHLMVTLANQVALAIHQMRLFEVEERQRQRMETLRLATAKLPATLQLNEVLAKILEQLRLLIEYDSACIFLRNEWGLLAVAATGFENIDEIVGHYFTADQDLYVEIEKTGKPLVVEDTRQDSRFYGWAGTSHILSWLGVPMQIQGRVIGYITIDSFRPGFFTDDDADLAIPFANQAGMVIENARLFETERRQHLVAQMQQDAAALLTVQMGVEQMLDAILVHLERVIPYDSASIMLLEAGDRMVMSASRYLDISSKDIEIVTSGAEKHLLTKFEHSDIVFIGDTETDSRWIPIPGNPVRSWVGAVLSIRDEPIGLINIDSHVPYTFDRSDTRIVRAFAHQAAMAIYNARMFEQTQQALRRTEILYTTAQALIKAADLPAVVQIVAEQSLSALAAQRVTVHLFDISQERVLHRVVAQGNSLVLETPSAQESRAAVAALWQGENGRCLESRQPILSNQHPPDSKLRRDLASGLGDGHDPEQASPSLRIPLLGQEELLGLVLVERVPGESSFTLADVEMLGVISQQAAVVIQNMRLFASLDAEKSRLGMLYSLSRSVGSSLEFGTVLDRVLDEILAHLGGYRGFVLLAEPGSDRLKLVAGSDLTMEQTLALDEQLQVRIGYGVTGQAALQGQPIVVADVRDNEHWLAIPGLDDDVRSTVAIPLFAGLTLIGVINLVSTTPGFYGDRDLSLFSTISVPIALAIQNAQYYEGIQRRARDLRMVSDVLRSLNTATVLSDVQLDLVLGMQLFTGCSDLFFYELDETNSHLVEIPATTQHPEENEGEKQGARQTLPIPLSEISGSVLAANTETPGGNLEDMGGGQALLSGMTTYISDLDVVSLSPYEQSLSDLGIRSQLLAPLPVSGRIVGAIQLVWNHPYGFNPQHLPSVIQICDAVAMLMEKSRLLAQANRRAKEVESLYEFSVALRMINRAEEVLSTSLKLAADYLHASQGIILVPQDDTGRMIVVNTFGTQDGLTPPQSTEPLSVFGQVYRTGKAQLHTAAELADPGQDGSGYPGAGELSAVEVDNLSTSVGRWEQAHPDVQSFMIAPIRTERQTVGVLGLSSDILRGPFADSDLRLLSAMTEIIGSTLERANVLETLEKRVFERTSELAHANQQLQQLDKLKSEFVANISHELRTPLTNIKLYLHLIGRKQVEEQKAYLDVLNDESNKLQHLIETILDLSHLDAGMSGEPDDFAPLDIVLALHDAVESGRSQAEEKGIAVEADLPDERIYILGDPELLHQMMDKLITNGINYSQRGDTLRVQLTSTVDGVRLSVADSGMGISPDDMPHIFERFYRSTRATDANIPGTGLGLSVVKEIADRHNAQIDIASEINQGSTFTLWFPQIREEVL